MKAKSFVDKIKKMNDIKKNINYDLLFRDCPHELIYIYKNFLKLSFVEEPDYGLYIIIYNSILKRYGFDDTEKQKKFLLEKFNDLIAVKKQSVNNVYKSRNLRTIFEGYPLNYWN